MFGTSGVRGPVGDAVTADLALSLGRSLATEGYDHVVVGRDVRESGDLLSDVLCGGLRECGATVTRVGVASTPTIARSVGWLDADAGVSVTASHNPPTDNGFKFWLPSGQSFPTDRQAAITDRIQAATYALVPAEGLGHETYASNQASRHVQAIRDAISDVVDLDIIVDVGNGTGLVTVDALEALGCSVTTLNAQSDGRFPGRPSEPTEANCHQLVTLTAASDADLGIAHDGDADRMVAVASDGTFVRGDVLLALFAREAADEGDAIAAPVDTSLLVEDALSERGVTVRYTPIGDTFVAEQAAEPDVVFGGEPSGAWIWPSETLCPDGPLAACRLAELVDTRGPLTALVDELPSYPIHRTSIRLEDPSRAMEHVDHLVRETDHPIDDRDGVRVETGDGWFLIRPSGTEPLIRVTAEARSPDRAAALFEEAKSIVATARSSD